MRWRHLEKGRERQPSLPGLDEPVVRTFDAPEALGIRFHEVHARSAINAVPKASRMRFRWTVNPYRGCTHACTYCFARPTHAYLDLNARADFEREIVVKVNTPERVRAELGRPSWKGELVALGTNTDPYQWVERRYELTRHGIPSSVLIAPLMPGVNDAPEQVEPILALAGEAGARNVTPIGLHLRGEVREIFFDWLRQYRADLIPRYEELYERGAYLPAAERRRLSALTS